MARAQALAFGIVAIVAFPALAAEPSGQAVAVVPSATAGGASGSRALSVNGPVFQGDVVTTSGGGRAELLFRDDTRLVVGPGSRVAIDDFVFQSQRTAKSVSINALRGTFRFITGNSPKQAYNITTPSATLGIRGTEFDLTIDAGGVSNLALYRGRVRLCDRGGGGCIELKGQCSVATAPRGATPEQLTGGARANLLRAKFPYAMNQTPLRTDFRVNVSACPGGSSGTIRSGTGSGGGPGGGGNGGGGGGNGG